MKRLIVILLLIPSLAFATYTEFYCQSTGSNLNACSTNGAVVATQTGDWVTGTHVFTPNDGTNPVSLGITTGMFASVYVTAGATATGYIGRISAVTNATNGSTTVDLVPIGASPASSSGAHTITMKVGGACLGPNAATGFPLTLAAWGVNKDSTAHMARLNLKNDQTYTLTASFAMPGSGAGSVIQGYTSTVNDGGRATFDGTTNTGTIISTAGTINHTFADLIFLTSITTGSADLVTTTVGNTTFIRCVFTGSRGNGVVAGNSSVFIECEAYNNNTSNTASKQGFDSLTGATFINCISHDNTGSNTAGFRVNSNQSYFYNCIADTNGGNGLAFTANDVSGMNIVQNCDFYNNASNGITIPSTTTSSFWITNCNFIKNTAAGINNASVVNSGFLYNNGYGAGTQANGSVDNTNNFNVSGAVTYASNVTPWVDPANGNFTINLAAALNAGRGAFTTTASSYGPTVGYPSIGAAQGPTPTPTPTATATATFTPTPVPTCTATATATATATPTATSTSTPTPSATATSTPTPTPPIETSDAHQ